jgi:hypothetical protein
MKIRQGFVSNSSSSSFMIVGEKDAKVKLQILADATELCSDVISNEKDLEEYISREYAWEIKNDDEYVLQFKERIKKNLEDGKIIYIGRCSNEDENPISNAMYDGHGIEVINGEIKEYY